jgi:inner membrane protein involved in colicin E2 resistance
MLKKHQKIRFSSPAVALLVADGLFFGLINPHNVAAIWLMVGYLLLAVTILSAVHGLAKLLKWYGDETQRIGRSALHYGAAAILLVIALQSTGQLTLRDVIALVPLTALAFWYFGLRRPKLATVPVRR